MQRIDLRPPVAVLALVLAVAAAGCGSDGDGGGTAAPADTTRVTESGVPPNVIGLNTSRAPGGRAVTAAALDRTVALLERRLAAIGLAGARVERVDATRIEVTLPDRAAAARAKPVLVDGRLAFYDWEASVVGPDGRHHPRDERVTGGMAAGQLGSGTVPAAQALRIAHRVPGAILVRPESDPAQPSAVKAARDAYFVLAGRRFLTGGELRNVQADTDSVTGQPDVTFTLTAAGGRAWQRATRVIARRGLRLVKPGQTPIAVAQHFAIVLDDQLISVPFIDPQQNPDGIHTPGGQISASFTIASARALAALLDAGPLPVALIPE